MSMVSGGQQRERWQVAVAYSAGRDSTALLHATARMARDLGGIDVLALHVHHGLSAQADDWLAHAQAQCAQWAAQGLPVSIQWAHLRLSPRAGESVEAVARQGRYAALANMAGAAGCDTVLLAHHRRDQAETFLLQALRGAGVAGLAAMPQAACRDGITWLRPWLDHPRSAIDAYIVAHGLPFVDDDSNGDGRFARNRLRLDVWPALARAFDHAEGALAQAAAHQADVLACMDDWLAEKLPLITRAPAPGVADAAGGSHAQGGALDVAAWRQWAAGPQRELLRAWFRQVAGQGLPASWVARLYAEVGVGSSARWPISLRAGDGVACHGEIVFYRGWLTWRPLVGVEANAVQGCQDLVRAQEGEPPWPLRITAPGRWPLPHDLGYLVVSPLPEGQPGLPLSRLLACELRPRHGQERFQVAVNRPARSLKKQFQMLGVPAWARQGPLLWGDGELLFVPGLGLNAPALSAGPAGERVALRWEPQAQDNIKVTE